MQGVYQSIAFSVDKQGVNCVAFLNAGKNKNADAGTSPVLEKGTQVWYRNAPVPG
jgi:hypothetical protein